MTSASAQTTLSANITYMESDPLRAWIYLRASLDHHDDEATIRRHEQNCRRLCDTRGFVVVGTSTDNDTSAYAENRADRASRNCSALSPRAAAMWSSPSIPTASTASPSTGRRSSRSPAGPGSPADRHGRQGR